MTATVTMETSTFEALLRAELQTLPMNRPEIQVERYADQMDNSVAAVQREMAEGELHRLSEKASAILNALRKIHRGEYGVCEQCEEEIHERRLRAVPWALLCLRCAEAVERDRAESRVRRDDE